MEFYQVLNLNIDYLSIKSSLFYVGDLVACGVLSGNRNFEGRIHPLTRANYLASPMLVLAYALAGTVCIDFETTPLGIVSVLNSQACVGCEHLATSITRACWRSIQYLSRPLF